MNWNNFMKIGSLLVAVIATVALIGNLSAQEVPASPSKQRYGGVIINAPVGTFQGIRIDAGKTDRKKLFVLDTRNGSVRVCEADKLETPRCSDWSGN